jgi:hypothetical protein
MSIHVINAIWTNSKAKLGDRLVLLYIATRGNDDGTGAYPSVGTIATNCNLSVRAVQGSIKRLVQIGEMKVDQSAGPHGVNVYQVTVEGCKICTPADFAPVQNTTSTPAESAPPPRKIRQGPPAESAPNTSVNTSTETSTETSRAYPADFEQFWSGYPKGHGSKKASFVRWKALSAAKRIAAWESLPAFHAGKNWQEGFVKDCEKFLHLELFENPPEPWRKPVGNAPNGYAKPRFDASGQRLLTSADLRRMSNGESLDEPDRNASPFVDPAFRVAESARH